MSLAPLVGAASGGGGGGGGGDAQSMVRFWPWVG